MAVKSCPTCGRDDTGERDFCPGCGSYLRWDEDPEQADTAVLTPASDSELRREPTSTALEPVPPAATDEVVMAPAGLLSDTPTVVLPAVPDVQVTVRVPGRDEDPAEVDVATVEPDGRTVLLATVRNQSGVVESYSLRIQGLPDGWYAVTPDVVHLVPFGAESGDYEASLELTITPPRSPESRAGVWPIEVVAVTHPDGRPVGASPARIVIGGFQQFECRVRPERARGDRSCVSPSPCETSATPRCHCGSVPRTPRTRCPSPSTLRGWRSRRVRTPMRRSRPPPASPRRAQSVSAG